MQPPANITITNGKWQKAKTPPYKHVIAPYCTALVGLPSQIVVAVSKKIHHTTPPWRCHDRFFTTLAYICLPKTTPVNLSNSPSVYSNIISWVVSLQVNPPQFTLPPSQPQRRSSLPQGILLNKPDQTTRPDIGWENARMIATNTQTYTILSEERHLQSNSHIHAIENGEIIRRKKSNTKALIALIFKILHFFSRANPNLLLKSEEIAQTTQST